MLRAARLSPAPLRPTQVRKGDWVAADGTTLGSDNGERGNLRARQQWPALRICVLQPPS